ncbi:MAG: transketolase C-terminal domain-containing protein [Chloroflexota bacterium]
MADLTMRDAFLDELFIIASKDRDVILITNDLGAPSLDKFRRDLSSQFIHGGISEQNQVNLAAGLAMEGKRVFLYSIIPFLPLRCLEQIRLHLCVKDLPVTLVGLGAGYAYDKSGPTHHGIEDVAIMRALPNMTILTPSDSNMAAAFSRMDSERPRYIRLDREGLPQLYGKIAFTDGFISPRSGRDMTIIATGYMVHQALRVSNELQYHDIYARVLDLYRIKPVNVGALLQAIQGEKLVVTLEEHFVNGGIGSIVAEILADNGKSIPLLRLGIPNHYFHDYGRETLHKLCGLDEESIIKRIRTAYDA